MINTLDDWRFHASVHDKLGSEIAPWSKIDRFISRYIDWNAKPANIFEVIQAWHYAIANKSSAVLKKTSRRVEKVTWFMNEKYPDLLSIIAELLRNRSEFNPRRKSDTSDDYFG